MLPNMTDAALAEAVDFYRIEASVKHDPKRRAALGQYMTPIQISRFMASPFSDTHGDLPVLDAGAGVGSLTAAFAARICGETAGPRSVESVCYEIDAVLLRYPADTLRQAEARCQQAQISATGRLLDRGFILGHAEARQPELFDAGDDDAGFTHAILNPPYLKIRTGSAHRRASSLRIPS